MQEATLDIAAYRIVGLAVSPEPTTLTSSRAYNNACLSFALDARYRTLTAIFMPVSPARLSARISPPRAETLQIKISGDAASHKCWKISCLPYLQVEVHCIAILYIFYLFYRFVLIISYFSNLCFNGNLIHVTFIFIFYKFIHFISITSYIVRIFVYNRTLFLSI